MFFSVSYHPFPFKHIFNSFRFWGYTSPKVSVAPLQDSACLPAGTKQDEERLVRLKAQVMEARQRRARSSYRTTSKEERWCSNETFRCTNCGVVKVRSAFFVDSRHKYGYRPTCTVCKREQECYYYGCTLRGIMTRILHNAKSTSQRSKIQAQFELTRDYLLTLWENQQGRCKYSGLVLSLPLFTCWRLSLERLDNNLGYVAGNVAFICVEFNISIASTQWSQHKVQMLPDKIDRDLSLCINDVEVEQIANTYKKRSIPSTCRRLQYVDRDFFSKNRCIVAERNVRKTLQFLFLSSNLKAFGWFLRTRLASAQCIAVDRRSKGRISAGEFSLTIDDLLSMYQEQKGICFYSGVRLCLQPSSEWMCSIERLDNEKGYVRDNVVLICAEFQTADHSYHAKEPVKGSAQWSRGKVQTLVQWLRLHRKSVP